MTINSSLAKILAEARGVSLVPFVFENSMKISGISEAEFQKSAGRALSIYKAFKFFKYDAILSEVAPLTSFKASGSMGKVEMNQASLRSIQEISIAIETTRKVAEMSRSDEGDIMALIYGESYLCEKFQTKIEDRFTLLDNLANLEHILLEAGCTSVAILESDLKFVEENIDSYSIFPRVAEVYGGNSVFLLAGVDRTEMSRELALKAKDAGFSFLGPIARGEDLSNLNACFCTAADGDGGAAAPINEIMQLKEKMPVLVFFPDSFAAANGRPGATRSEREVVTPEKIKQFVNSFRDSLL